MDGFREVWLTFVIVRFVCLKDCVCGLVAGLFDLFIVVFICL